MEEYKELLKLLKVTNLSIQILHRHLIGECWFADHTQLGEYYNHVQDDVDTLCELGLAIGVEEPKMQEALDKYKEIEIIDREAIRSYEAVRDMFSDIVAQINRISDVPADVINKLQEIQEYYRVEVDFKLTRAIKE